MESTHDLLLLLNKIKMDELGKKGHPFTMPQLNFFISHHHGIGKMFAPWLDGYIGAKEYGVFKVLKNYFDPQYNMNPGGTIGLDLLPEENKFDRQYTDYEAQQKFD